MNLPNLRPRAMVTSGLLAFSIALTGPALAQTAAPKKPAKPAAKAPAKGKKAAPPAPVVYVPPEADADQVSAAGRVYYGAYDCEFKQSIDITANPKFGSYVDVKFGKLVFTMKPVLSSTGAIRLEDILGETLMVQISSKSMMLNVKSGHRMVDDCVSPEQRAAIEKAAALKATEAEEAKTSAAAASAAVDGVAAPAAPASAASAP